VNQKVPSEDLTSIPSLSLCVRAPVRPLIWALICAVSAAVQRECFKLRSDFAVDTLRLFAAKPVRASFTHEIAHITRAAEKTRFFLRIFC
jgi:hypothetical protein